MEQLCPGKWIHTNNNRGYFNLTLPRHLFTPTKLRPGGLSSCKSLIAHPIKPLERARRKAGLMLLPSVPPAKAEFRKIA
jgi:hypothetical protein